MAIEYRVTEGLKEKEKQKVSELKIDKEKERYINKAKNKMKKTEK